MEANPAGSYGAFLVNVATKEVKDKCQWRTRTPTLMKFLVGCTCLWPPKYYIESTQTAHTSVGECAEFTWDLLMGNITYRDEVPK